MLPMSRVGIKDIARSAGVSIATVSHAFRNPNRVSDKTREKVLDAANRLGYTPNRHAVGLRTARSGNIVVVIPDIADSYNTEIIKGIESVAHGRSYSVLLGDTQGSAEREREFAAMVRSRQADGIILMSHRLPFDLPDDVAPEDIPPLVNGSEYVGNEAIPSVSIDDKQGGKDATRHLIDLGHKRIAIVTGDKNSTSTRGRLEGFREVMSESGLTVDEDLIIYGQYRTSDGEAAANKLMIRDELPTAVFCFGDEIALGCMHTLKRAGLVIPKDISVIGFDDIPFARYFAPSLTTVAQPAREIGQTCASLLLDLIDGVYPENNRVILPHTLVVRSSTQRVNQK